jgi:hypothetical protein
MFGRIGRHTNTLARTQTHTHLHTHTLTLTHTRTRTHTHLFGAIDRIRPGCLDLKVMVMVLQSTATVLQSDVMVLQNHAYGVIM